MTGVCSHAYQSVHNPKCFRRLNANVSFMFNLKPPRSERVRYANIMNRVPRQIIDSDMVMPAARAFAAGYIDRDTMMRLIDAGESAKSP